MRIPADATDRIAIPTLHQSGSGADGGQDGYAHNRLSSKGGVSGSRLPIVPQSGPTVMAFRTMVKSTRVVFHVECVNDFGEGGDRVEKTRRLTRWKLACSIAERD